MKITMRNNFLIIVALLALSIAGCKKPDLQADLHVTVNLRTAGNYIQNNYAFSLFAYAVQKAGLMDSLNNPNLNYTLLLPDNTAFNTDSINTNADLDAWGIDSLRFFVRTHILPGKLFISDIPTNLDNLYPNLTGISLYVSAGAYGTYYVNGISIKQEDIALVNGVIQVLSNPLKVSTGTVQAFVAARPDLKDLVAGLKKFNLWDDLGKASTVTVFAPRDTSFNTAGLTTAAIDTFTISRYNSVLFSCYFQPEHHLFLSDPATLVPALLSLPGGYLFGMSGGCTVLDPTRTALGPLGPRFFPQPNASRVTPYLDANHTNYVCSNGIVHLLSGVLVLPIDVIH